MNSVQMLNLKELTRAMEWVYNKSTQDEVRAWAEGLMHQAYTVDLSQFGRITSAKPSKPNLTIVRPDDANS